MMFFKKKETAEEKAERLERLHAEMEQICNQGKEKYDRVVSEVQKILSTSNKPEECNTIRFTDTPYLFPTLKSFQYYTDWEIWRNGNILYIYCAAVEDYPEEYFGGDAPMIAGIPIDSIQYFRIEGEAYAETKISGGKVTQSRYTGKIKQTELKSKTIHHDTRIVKMSVLVNGVVKILDLEYSALDILTVLIPEKERK